MEAVANKLIDLCRSAQRELVLVAPFIKVDVIRRLLAETPTAVSVTCITRWRPEEIAAGISDLEVWEVIRARPAAALFLRHNLHAKYFRGDDRCLVGSANLTATALGWSQRSNLELLITVNPSILVDFEGEAKTNTVCVDDAVRSTMAKAVAAIKEPPLRWLADTRPQKPADATAALDLGTWLPACRRPDKLYSAYLGKRDELIEDAYEAATQDLAMLDIPSGLDRQPFELIVATTLQQMPLVRKVDEAAVTPQSFDSLASLLRAELGDVAPPNFDADDAWQTMVRWLVYFFRDRYRTIKRAQEFFVKPESTDG